MYIPPGFNTVTPYFVVEHAESFIGFLIAGLDGTETCRTMSPAGKVRNVQIRLGTSTVMISEATGKYWQCADPIIFMLKMPMPPWPKR